MFVFYTEQRTLTIACSITVKRVKRHVLKYRSAAGRSRKTRSKKEEEERGRDLGEGDRKESRTYGLQEA
jgi:hypothetical protein